MFATGEPSSSVWLGLQLMKFVCGRHGAIRYGQQPDTRRKKIPRRAQPPKSAPGPAGPHNEPVTTFAWIVLASVFVDELLVMAAFGVRGWQADPRWLLVWVLPLLAMLVWWAFASPKARYGGPVVRPVTKVLVFGLASLALWDAGHPRWAFALLAFSVVVNGLAQLPRVRSRGESLTRAETTRGGG
jgi:hypothetical protein